MALAGVAATQFQNPLNRLVDIIDGDVQMDANLSASGLRNRLEVDPRLIVARLQLNPSRQSRLKIAVQHRTPELGDPAGVRAVDRETAPPSSHSPVNQFKDSDGSD